MMPRHMFEREREGNAKLKETAARGGHRSAHKSSGRQSEMGDRESEREREVVRTNKRPSEAVMEQGEGRAKKCGGHNGAEVAERWSGIEQKQRTTKWKQSTE